MHAYMYTHGQTDRQTCRASLSLSVSLSLSLPQAYSPSCTSHIDNARTCTDCLVRSKGASQKAPVTSPIIAAINRTWVWLSRDMRVSPCAKFDATAGKRHALRGRNYHTHVCWRDATCACFCIADMFAPGWGSDWGIVREARACRFHSCRTPTSHWALAPTLMIVPP